MNNSIFTSFASFINERYSPELNEKFKSSKMSAMIGLNLVDKNLMKALYGFTKVKLDQITDDQLTEMDPTTAYKTKAAPNALFFYISDNEKDNPYATTSDSFRYKTIPGNTLLAVSNGKNEMYAVDFVREFRGERKASLKNTGRYGEGTGIDKRHSGYDSSGLSNIKRISEVADRVLMFDPAVLPSATDDRALRQADKAGATAFMSDKDFKAANMSKYREILNNRSFNDDIDGIVLDAIDTLSTQIKKALTDKAIGRYGDLIIGLDPKGREVRYTDASSEMSRIMDAYSKYSTHINSIKEADAVDKRRAEYHKAQAAESATDVKKRAKRISKLDYAW